MQASISILSRALLLLFMSLQWQTPGAAGPGAPKDKFPHYNPAHTVIKCPYIPAGMKSTQLDPAAGLLAVRHTLIRRFNAVIHRVAHQVYQRIGKGLNDLKNELEKADGKSEESLFKSAAFDNATVALMMIDRDFIVTYVNETTQQLLSEQAETFKKFWPNFFRGR